MTPVARSLVASVQTLAMSFLLAMLVWLYAWQQDTAERDLPQVPVAVEAPDGAQTIRIEDGDGVEVQQVMLKVYGSRTTLSGLTGRDLRCRLRLGRVQVGDSPLVQEVVLGPGEFNLPSGVQVRAVPPVLRVTLVKQGVQRMRVRTTDCYTGVPRAGFRILDVSASPTYVEVRGPAAIVQKYREIPVEKVDVTDQAEDFSQVTGVVSSLDGAPVQSDSRVSLLFTLQEEETEREFTLRVHILQPIEFPLRLEKPEPESATVKVRGPRSQVLELKETDLVLYADLFSLYRDPHQMQPGQIYKPRLELRVLNERLRDVKLVGGEDLEFTITTAK